MKIGNCVNNKCCVVVYVIRLLIELGSYYIFSTATKIIIFVLLCIHLCIPY